MILFVMIIKAHSLHQKTSTIDASNSIAYNYKWCRKISDKILKKKLYFIDLRKLPMNIS